ncbi:YbaB/EbfC family nucleoid-associated protein [Amycolatopsis sp. NBC_01480]|uniref:YbaB/EbfC family nucleoid-associated protein n=1 Tax=Amycolatopsis sp. NBC_01480 TaxID=2903562 RepID=UPI002E2B6034|nr:YbaB/EbfC family nucleoid-associated protein [Amycolatopsis sp. NBC_01480]
MSIYNQLYALTQEIEANLHRTEAAAAAAAEVAINRRIPGGAGAVTVSGRGTLVSVTIDPHGLTSTNGRALGAQIAQTIREAEVQARAQMNQALQNASAASDSARRETSD